MSKHCRVAQKMKMRRPRISEILLLLSIFAFLAFIKEKEQNFFDETSNIEEFSEDESEFVDLGSKRNKIKEKFDKSLKEELSEAEYERQLLQFLKSQNLNFQQI